MSLTMPGRRLFQIAQLLILLPLALAISNCGGGPTGFQLEVTPPLNTSAPTDYDTIQVQVTEETKDRQASGQLVGQKFQLTSIDKVPYVLIIQSDGSPQAYANITVGLLKNGMTVESRFQGDVPFESGMLLPVPFNFNEQ